MRALGARELASFYYFFMDFIHLVGEELTLAHAHAILLEETQTGDRISTIPAAGREVKFLVLVISFCRLHHHKPKHPRHEHIEVFVFSYSRGRPDKSGMY